MARRQASRVTFALLAAVSVVALGVFVFKRDGSEKGTDKLLPHEEGPALPSAASDQSTSAKIASNTNAPQLVKSDTTKLSNAPTTGPSLHRGRHAHTQAAGIRSRFGLQTGRLEEGQRRSGHCEKSDQRRARHRQVRQLGCGCGTYVHRPVEREDHPGNGSSPPTSYNKTWKVESGQVLQKIAKRFDVTSGFLCRINGLSNATKLQAADSTIKVIQGPFHVVVSKSRFEADVYLGSAGGPGSMYVKTFRVGLGSDNSTPTGTWQVDEGKLVDPVYYSLCGEGIITADDPKNPLGERWIPLKGIEGECIGKESYGIHGTIDPDSIGKNMPMGCIRLAGGDIEQLYDLLIEQKSTVKVVDEPYRPSRFIHGPRNLLRGPLFDRRFEKESVRFPRMRPLRPSQRRSFSFRRLLPPHDLLIRTQGFDDGTGNAWFYADVAVDDDRISAIGDLSAQKGTREIDIQRRTSAPGFIDVHTHVDEDIHDQPLAENFIRDGVTTIVSGNCGGSVLNVKTFFDRINKEGSAVNNATLVGHNSILRKVKGFRRRQADRRADDRREQIVDTAMKDAIGFSTGLIYTPGTWSDTDEIIEMMKVAGGYGGIYATHMRSESGEIKSAIDERCGSAGKPTVEWRSPTSRCRSILADKFGRGTTIAAGSDVTLAMVEDEREKAGQEVWLDQYPYTASSTTMQTLLPDWVLEKGGDEAKKILRDPQQVQKFFRKCVNSTK